MVRIMETIQKTYSHSQLAKFTACRRSYWYEYVENILPIKRPRWSRIGTCGHRALAHYYRKKPFEEFRLLEGEFDIADESDATDAVRLVGTLRAYVKLAREWDTGLKYDPLKDVETSIEGMLFDKKFKGILDLLAKDNGKTTIIDHKITGNTERSIIADRKQICTYFHLVPAAEQFAVNVLARPYRLRPRKAEELEHFEKRIIQELLEHPENYFLRKVYYRGEFDIEAWKQETQIRIEELEGLPKEIGFFYPNERNCSIGECEYQSICETGEVDWTKFKKRGPR